MAKRQDKSNKTAHVLNLITSPAQKQAAAQRAAGAAASDTLAAGAETEMELGNEAGNGAGNEVAEAAQVNQQAAQVRQPLIPPILQVANHHDETLAEQINSALLQELDADDKQEPPAQPAMPPSVAAERAPAVGAAPPQSTQTQASQPPQPVEQPVIEPVEDEPFKLPQSAIVSSFTIPEPPPLPPIQEELQYINVMQKLVESMAPEYINRLGVCKCQRCLEDVKALALTNLGPKYTVFPASERIPMLTVYERRYSSRVATELTKACAVVKANPRHN